MVRGAEGVADMDVGDPGYGHNGTNLCFLHFHFVQAVKLIELAHLDTALFFRVMVVADNHVLIYLQGTAIHFPYSDAAHIFIIVDGADENLGAFLRVSFRGGDIV